jgi:archaeal holliday junction resolvase (hjc)
MTNKKLGNDFESKLCEMLFKEGFWVHNFTQNQAGQPADIIAVKNKIPFLIDAKVCSDNKFPLSRIEENQRSSMDLWHDCKNGTGWFAFLIEDEVFMMAYTNIKSIEADQLGKSALTLSDFVEKGLTFDEWVRICQ